MTHLVGMQLMRIFPGRQPKAAPLLAAVLSATACASDDSARYEEALASVVAAERAFASAATELGIRDAFIAHLAADAVIFRPRPVDAQQHLRDQEAVPGLLTWDPVFADVSDAGDLGFTTGPWTFRRAPEEEPLGHGNYFTVWKQQSDGTWKAVIDHGTMNPPPESIPSLHHPEGRPGEQRIWDRGSNAALEREKLLQVDRAFAGAAAANGILSALTGYVASDVRTLRNGLQPQTGIAALRALVQERPGSLSWVPLGGDVSRSGDLGYTYGEWQFTPAGSATAEAGTYLRAWRRHGDSNESWRVIVDLMVPLPGPAEAEAG